jgi:septum formation protein
VAPEVEELGTGGDPPDLVLENARRKARAALEKVGEKPRNALLLGADTEVILDGRMLGKAAAEPDARAHLEALSGRAHTVLGGLVLLEAATGRERTGIASSEVTFRGLDPETLDLYLRSGEWRDRAGAYAIQGLGSILVERLEGDFSNVVGLSVPLLLELAPELRRNLACTGLR